MMKRVLFPAMIILPLFMPSLASAALVSDRVEAIDQLLILNAAQVEVTPGAPADSWTVAIQPSAVNLIGVKPRPFMRALQRRLLMKTWRGLVEKARLPAVLTWWGPHGEERAALTLSQPAMDAKTGTFVFLARQAAKTSRTLGRYGLDAGKPLIPGTLKQATLYLDDEQGRVVRYSVETSEPQSSVSGSSDAPMVLGCVLQPWTVCEGLQLDILNQFPDGGGISLIGLDLTGVEFRYSNLNGLRMNDAILYEADLRNSSMLGTNLTGANLGLADLSYAVMGQGVDVAILTSANLSYAEAYQANLSGVHLDGVNLIGADFTGANLSFTDMSYTTMSREGVDAAILTNANLSHAELWYVDLTGVSLNHANLSGADLTGSDLSGADLSGANLAGVHYCNTTMPDGSTNDRDCWQSRAE